MGLTSLKRFRLSHRTRKKTSIGSTGLIDRILDLLDQQAWYQSARQKKKKWLNSLLYGRYKYSFLWGLFHFL